MAKTRRVVATGATLGEAYFCVSKAIPTGTRERKCLDKADAEIGMAARITHKMDGSWDLGVAADTIGECVFSEEAIYGVKVGLVQAITGASLGRPAPIGNVKYTILPTAKAFGIEKLVRKDAKIDEDDGELDDLELEFDDAAPPAPVAPPAPPAAKAAEEAEKK